MKRVAPTAPRLLFGILLVVTALGTSRANAAAMAPEDRRLLIYFAEAEHLDAFARDRSWRQYRFDNHPLLVFDPDRVAFQFNSRRPLAGFTTVANPPVKTNFPIFIKRGPTDQLAAESQSTEVVSRIRGMAIISVALSGIRHALPVGYSPASFHYFPLLAQFGGKYPWYSEYMSRGQEWMSQYPTLDAENFALADLENACLRQAVAAVSADEAKRVARWFAAVRHLRHSQLGGLGRRHENYQELLPAMARLAASQMATLGSHPQYRPIEIFKAGGRSYAYPAQNALTAWLVRTLDVPLDALSLVRERPSTTGMAQGVLLDRLGSQNWRNQLGSAESLSDLLSRAVGFSETDQKAMVDEAKAAYNYEAKFNVAEGHIVNARNMAEAFNRQPGRTIKVRLPKPKSHGRVAGPPGLQWLPISHRPLELDNRTRLMISLEQLTFQDQGVAIKLQGVPIKFYSTDPSWPYRDLILRLPLTDQTVQLDGRLMPVQNGTYRIQQGLKIKTTKAQLQISRGSVKVADEAVEIELGLQ